MTASKFPAQTIGIIGGGFCGTMVAVHLLKQATYPLHIKLIERQSTLGQGVAYSTPIDSHLLNVPVGRMSAFADRYLQNHFLDWLHSLPYSEFRFAEPITAQSFVPRQLYGKYLQAILQEAIRHAHPEVTFTHLQAEAQAVQPTVQGVAIQLSSGRSVTVDRVVLALGNFPPADPFGQVSPFDNSPRYISNPWSPKAMQQVDPDRPILIIGSGLSMVDWAIALYQQGFCQPIQVISRRGLLPYVHEADRAVATLGPAYQLAVERLEQLRSGQFRSLRQLMHWLRQEVWEAEQEGYNWRSVIDALRPHIPAIWQDLPVAERRRFLRHVRPYWEIHRHRTAPKIARTIEQLQQSGQLQIQAGRLQYYRRQPNHMEVWLQLRDGRLTAMQVGTIVNCTGSECNYRKLRHPLIAQLLQSGLVQPDVLGMGFKVAANGALIHNNQQASDWLFTLGPAQKGSLWETTAVPELRQQAASLAQGLLQWRDRRGSPTPFPPFSAKPQESRLKLDLLR